MGVDGWFVLFAGIAGIAWVNWYFFFAGRGSVAAVAGAGGVQEVRVTVRGGYEPGEVRVRAGAPVRLVFDRQESAGCSEEVVVPDFGIRRFLAAHDETVVEFTPEAAGSYDFMCGMSMLRGRIIVEPRRDDA